MLKQIISTENNEDTLIDENHSKNKIENLILNDTSNLINITDVNSNNMTRINNTNNESEMILIEEVSYFKNKLNDTSINIGRDLVNDHNINTSNFNSKFQIFPIIDETIKCESDNEENVNLLNQENESEKLIKEEVIIHEEPDYEDLKTQILVTNNYSATGQVRIEGTSNIQNLMLKKDSNFSKLKNVNKIYDETYDQFLEDTLFDGNQYPDHAQLNHLDFITNKKDPMQEILRAQMKSIASNIKDRKKDKECVVNKKKKNLLENILSLTGNTNTLDTNSTFKDTYKSKQAEIITFGKKNSDLLTNNDISGKLHGNKNNNFKENIKSSNSEFINVEKINCDKEDNYKERDILEKDYTDDFISEEVKSHEEALDEKELTSIHQTMRMEEVVEVERLPKTLHEEELPCQKFDLKEFLKENTRDEIYCQNESDEENENNDFTNYYNQDKNRFRQSPTNTDNKNKYLYEDLEFEEIQPVSVDPQVKYIHKNSDYSKNENCVNFSGSNNTPEKKNNRLIILENEENPTT